MQVIGAGLGRTGTHSLKLALEQLGLGPCHHMEEVISHMAEQVPLWQAAVDGTPDWPAIYRGYRSAVDWPTAGFFRELAAGYPSAKVILTLRSAESWAASYEETIGKLMAGADQFPPHMQDWLRMAEGALDRSGVRRDLDRAGLMAAFTTHNEAVRTAIPESRLLVFEVKEGWEPLCAFLGLPVPQEPFPRTNNRQEFWEILSGAAPAGQPFEPDVEIV